MIIRTLEWILTDRTARETDNVVETFEDRIQNATLAAVENFITLRVESAVRSTNASSGRNAANVAANLERGEQVGITTCFENISDRIDTFHKLNMTVETRGCNPNEVSESLDPRTYFDRQPHTHYSNATAHYYNLEIINSSFSELKPSWFS